MPQAKTSQLHDLFASLQVVTCFSDRSVNFVLPEDQSELSLSQRQFLSEQAGFPITKLINIRQVHGDHVITVTAEDLRISGPLPEADGIITKAIGVPIAVRTADCLPVFIFDPKKNCIGLVHAGWRGSEKQIALKAVKLMRDNWACAPEDLRIGFGPAIRSCCYQVGPEFENFFSQEVSKKSDKLFLDLVAANRNQLLRYGIKPKNILDCGICTCCNPDYFSYRREGSGTGRHISVMALRPR